MRFAVVNVTFTGAGKELNIRSRNEWMAVSVLCLVVLEVYQCFDLKVLFWAKCGVFRKHLIPGRGATRRVHVTGVRGVIGSELVFVFHFR